MKTVTIAFDIDGTLISEITETDGSKNTIIAENIRLLLITLSFFRNVRIHLWSGSGEVYARQMARELGITRYIKSYSSKSSAGFIPDIAIDDAEDMSLGLVNLIVSSAHSSEDRASASQ